MSFFTGEKPHPKFYGDKPQKSSTPFHEKKMVTISNREHNLQEPINAEVRFAISFREYNLQIYIYIIMYVYIYILDMFFNFSFTANIGHLLILGGKRPGEKSGKKSRKFLRFLNESMHVKKKTMDLYHLAED